MCWHSSTLRIYCFADLDLVFGGNLPNFSCVSVHEVRAWLYLAGLHTCEVKLTVGAGSWGS